MPCVLPLAPIIAVFAFAARSSSCSSGLGHEVDDVGTFTDESVDYPDIAALVARRSATARPSAAS